MYPYPREVRFRTPWHTPCRPIGPARAGTAILAVHRIGGVWPIMSNSTTRATGTILKAVWGKPAHGSTVGGGLLPGRARRGVCLEVVRYRPPDADGAAPGETLLRAVLVTLAGLKADLDATVAGDPNLALKLTKHSLTALLDNRTDDTMRERR